MQIPDLCKMIMSGAAMQKEQVEALQKFMRLPENLFQILEASWKEPAILMCYKSFTRECRRTGEYFSNSETYNELQLIRFMLEILCGAPEFISQHQCNIYLSFEGELLAAAMEKEVKAEFIEDFLERVMDLQIVQEIKIHYILKILTSCFEEILERRTRTGTKALMIPKITRFISRYSHVVLPFIDQVAQEISETFSLCEHPLGLVYSLLQAQQSFLKVMGQSELEYQLQIQSTNEQNFEGSSKRKAAIYIMSFQENSLSLWVDCICFFINEIVPLIEGQGEQKIFKSFLKVGPALSQCINMVSHLHKITFEQSQISTKSITLYLTIEDIILKNLVDPFFNGYDDQLTFQKILPGEFHVLFLKLLISSPELLKDYIKFPSEKSLDPKIENVIKIQMYCNAAINQNYFQFTDFSQCPVGLSVKIMHLVMNFAVELYIRSGKRKKEIQFFQSEVQQIYTNFFESFILHKMIVSVKVIKENEELYKKGRNWYEFITFELDNYFEELAKCLPKCFYDSTIQYNCEILKEFLGGKKRFDPGLVQGEKLEKLLKDLELLQRNTSFKILQRMHSSLFYQKIDWQSEAEQAQFNERTQNKGNQEALLFTNLMPVLSCFHAFIKRLDNSKQRCYFFYQYFLLHKQIHLEKDLFVNEKKARLCVLYILHTFTMEIMPDSFYIQGEEASMTMHFLMAEFEETFDHLITQIIQLVSFCIDQTGIQSQQNSQIVEFGLVIFSRITNLMYDRVSQMAKSDDYFAKDIYKKYENVIEAIYSEIEYTQISQPIAFKKLFNIGGCIINVFGPSKLYSIFQKLRTKAFNESSDQQFDRSLELFFSGATGILKGIQSERMFRSAVELSLIQINSIKVENCFEVTENMMQAMIQFIDTLLCHKTMNKQQDYLRLTIWELFFEDMKTLMEMAESTEYEERCINLCLKMNKANQIGPLIPLPTMDLEKYPSVLAFYFQNASRVFNLSFLQPYIGLQLEWLLSFLEEKINLNQQIRIDIPETCSRFAFRDQHQQKLIQLLSMSTGLPFEQVKDTLDETYAEVKRVLFEKPSRAPEGAPRVIFEEEQQEFY